MTSDFPKRQACDTQGLSAPEKEETQQAEGPPALHGEEHLERCAPEMERPSEL